MLSAAIQPAMLNPIRRLCYWVRSSNCAPEHILYLGDAERDLLAAKAAGMVGGVALWGYLGEEDKPQNWPALAQFSSPLAVHQALVATR